MWYIYVINSKWSVGGLYLKTSVQLLLYFLLSFCSASTLSSFKLLCSCFFISIYISVQLLLYLLQLLLNFLLSFCSAFTFKLQFNFSFISLKTSVQLHLNLLINFCSVPPFLIWFVLNWFSTSCSIERSISYNWYSIISRKERTPYCKITRLHFPAFVKNRQIHTYALNCVNLLLLF